MIQKNLYVICFFVHHMSATDVRNVAVAGSKSICTEHGMPIANTEMLLLIHALELH